MNPELPVYTQRGEIVLTVMESPVSIIRAETGAGKTTQVPQFLHQDAGYRDIVVTQPRRLAASNVANRVAEEMNSPLGGLVGFRTAHERSVSAETEILFCTDGLELVRELTAQQTDILVIDEVHEWNLNIEVLVAYAKRRLAEDPTFKVVLMSATIETERLAKYFGDCPVIDVPGRIYSVEERIGSEIVRETVALARDGRNTLVFVPGKAEIARTIEELEDRLVGHATILPLHGELSSEDQQKIFRPCPGAKVIVSTNVAQTSVTIPDIDAVVDSGKERRTEVRDGIQGLYIGQISQADCDQRKGRAGRTKPGVYVLCSNTAYEDRPAFPTAEIERSRLDQTVLRLAVAGIDATQVEFFHQPDLKALHDARFALERLGAIGPEGEVTGIGRRMSKIPADVHLARMIVEANRRGTLDDVITIAACIEVGGIRMRPRGRWELPAWRTLTQERSSDLLAELDCFNAALECAPSQLEEIGIHRKSFFRAREARNHIIRSLPRQYELTSDGREAVLRSCVAGMVDRLYRYRGYSRFEGARDERELSKDSAIAGTACEWIVGIPFDLEVPARQGGTFTLNLINFASMVDPSWLVEVAPQLQTTELRDFSYDESQAKVVANQVTLFNGVEINSVVIDAPEGEESLTAVARWEELKKLDERYDRCEENLAELQEEWANIRLLPLDLNTIQVEADFREIESLLFWLRLYGVGERTVDRIASLERILERLEAQIFPPEPEQRPNDVPAAEVDLEALRQHFDDR